MVLPDKYVKWKCETDEGKPTKIKLKPEIVTDTEGYRIVNLESLGHFVTDLTMHAIRCPCASGKKEPVKLLGEVQNNGLASIIAAMCTGCGKTVTMRGPKMPGDNRYEINVRAVWAQMATGGGASHLREQCATMGMPSMHEKTFSSIEEQIGSWWKQVI